MARGRPRKTGQRERNGRLKRAVTFFDRGTERVQALKARYGEHYSSALGRAFAAGLLGTDDTAKIRLDVGKRFARTYGRFIEQDRYRCALNDSPRGGGNPEPESAIDQLRWLFDAMEKIASRLDRKFLDSLLTTHNTDTGPEWLDRILAGNRRPSDHIAIKHAIAALDAISPNIRIGGIRVAA